MKMTEKMAASIARDAGIRDNRDLVMAFKAAYEIYTEELEYYMGIQFDEDQTDTLTRVLFDLYLCGREDENNRLAIAVDNLFKM